MLTEYAILSHANLKQVNGQPTEVFVSKLTAFSWYWSETHKATHIVGNGGAIIPVLETPAEVQAKLSNVVLKGDKKCLPKAKRKT